MMKIVNYMDNIKKLVHNLILGRACKPSFQYKSLSKVEKIDDLPKRMYIGEIIKNTFENNDSSIKIKYGDISKGNVFKLEYDKKEKYIKGNISFQNQIGSNFIVTGDDYLKIMPGLSSSLNDDWINEINKHINDYNINMFINKIKDFPSYVYFPDGHMLSFVVPVPFTKLEDLDSMLNDFKDCNEDFISNLSFSLSLSRSTLSKAVIKEKEDINNSNHHTTSLKNGFIPSSMWEYTFPNNIHTHNFNRIHYNLIINFYIQDLEEVVSKLFEHSFLDWSYEKMKKINENDKQKQLNEQVWLINSGLEGVKGTFQSFTKDMSYRILYEYFTNENFIKELTKNVMKEDDFDSDDINMRKIIVNINNIWSDFIENLLSQVKK